ncbi:hypothetical protein TRVA0_019S01728 [Trichomonascus vanleenenianus]|uniref:DDHD family phospholipase n=1 Tax=Trichomonascus vanleenenianus TaxID=2268995 RepID=UPI003EC98E48
MAEPEVVPWFFHDSAVELDDPKATLPTSSTQTGSPDKPKKADKAAKKKEKDLPVPEPVKDAEAFAQRYKETKRQEREKVRAQLNANVHPIYSTTSSYVGTITPNPNWSAFNPSDNNCLEKKYQKSLEKKEKREDAVPVGLNRLYSVSVGKKSLCPIYWTSSSHYSNVHRSTWFYSSTLTPTDPSLEEAVAEAYKEVRPWRPEYLNEILSASTVPEALERMKIPIEYTQVINQEGKTQVQKVIVVFAPCCSVEEGEKSINEQGGEFPATIKQIEALSPTKYPVAYIFQQSSFANTMMSLLKNSASYLQLITALLSGKVPPGTVVTLQRHFSWDDWKKLRKLPDRPTDDPGFAPKKVTQLVLVLHGIGQKLSDRVEGFNFTYSINGFRIAINESLENPGIAHLLPSDANIMTLPINWRKTLNFEELKRNKDDNIVSKQEEFSLQDITMNSIPTVRNVISDVMLDIPYYMSHYKPMLLEAATKEANRVYQLFTKHHPYFLEQGGKVHLVGHSLGSVIAVDLLSHQPTDINVKPKYKLDGKPKFEFNITNLFLAGSPAAFFLLLNNGRLYPRKMFDEETNGKKAPEYGCLAVKRIYNIVHYSDPIAYLLNPTVDAYVAANLETAIIPTEKAFPLPGTENSGFFDSLASRIRFFKDSSSRESSRSRTENTATDGPQAEKNKPKDESSSSLQTTPNESAPALLESLPSEVELETRDFDKEYYGEKKMALLNDNGQIDYIIPLTGTLENQYFSMLTAHSGYWENKDFARLVAVECARTDPLPQFAAKKKT